MTPQDQEFLHDPANGQYGDCMRAMIASLLELPIATVPHFLQMAKGNPGDFWHRVNSFLAERGYEYLSMGDKHRDGYAVDMGGYHEIYGPSPRDPANVFHAVVGLNGKIVFDPHPSRAGLFGDSHEWRYGYIMKLEK